MSYVLYLVHKVPLALPPLHYFHASRGSGSTSDYCEFPVVRCPCLGAACCDLYGLGTSPTKTTGNEERTDTQGCLQMGWVVSLVEIHHQFSGNSGVLILHI